MNMPRIDRGGDAFPLAELELQMRRVLVCAYQGLFLIFVAHLYSVNSNTNLLELLWDALRLLSSLSFNFLFHIIFNIQFWAALMVFLSHSHFVCDRFLIHLRRAKLKHILETEKPHFTIWPSSLSSSSRPHTCLLQWPWVTYLLSSWRSYPSNHTSPGQPQALLCLCMMYREHPLSFVY